MTHDKTRLYPTMEDIFGKNAKKGTKQMAKEKVSYQSILQEIARIEERLKSNPAVLKGIQDQLNQAVSDFTLALSEGKPDEEVNAIAFRMDDLHRQERIQKSIDYATNSGTLQATIKANSKIKEMTAEFEKDRVADLESLAREKEKAIEHFKKVREDFLKATFSLGQINHRTTAICNELEEVRKYNTNPSTDLPYIVKYPFLKFPHINVETKQGQAWQAGARGQKYEDIAFNNTPKFKMDLS